MSWLFAERYLTFLTVVWQHKMISISTTATAYFLDFQLYVVAHAVGTLYLSVIFKSSAMYLVWVRCTQALSLLMGQAKTSVGIDICSGGGVRPRPAEGGKGGLEAVPLPLSQLYLLYTKSSTTVLCLWLKIHMLSSLFSTTEYIKCIYKSVFQTSDNLYEIFRL